MLSKILCIFLATYLNYCSQGLIEVNTIDSNTNCPKARFDMQEDYILDKNSCLTFQNQLADDKGATYIFTKENHNVLDDFQISYSNPNIIVYDFTNYEILENHIFGEITYRMCKNLKHDYYLLENDWDYDFETNQLIIDKSGHMSEQEFKQLCNSFTLL